MMATRIPKADAAIRTLLVNGFHLQTARRMVGHIILDAYSYDLFGVRIDYSIAIFDEVPSVAAVAGFVASAEHQKHLPLVVAPSGTFQCVTLTHEEFYKALGGSVDHSLLVTSDLASRLEQLGLNQVPEGMEGSAEELLEIAVKICLEYLLEHRAHRWGADRRFEPLPDGLAFGKSNLILLYDAKAHGNGYEPSAQDMRSFRTYIDDFHAKYERDLGRIHSFVVVSGKFPHSEGRLTERSAELYSACQVPICFLLARTLGEMVTILLKHPTLRPAVNWRQIFAKPVPVVDDLGRQIKSLVKDGILEGGG